MELVKVRSPRSRTGPSPNDWCLGEKRERDTRREHRVRTEAEITAMRWTPRSRRGHQEPPGATGSRREPEEAASPDASESLAPPTP